MSFDWKWNLSDLKDIAGGPTVFSTFACGGGSCMGYKRAGFDVVGCCELDPKINEIYKLNLHPKHNYLMDLRDFNKLENLPDELFNLDVLDGSPPCTTFSSAGQREKNWGKEKKFREGQKHQRLDDLFFVFLDTVEKLQPRVVVAENVKGMILGNARGYVSEIVDRFHELGYDVQVFLLNAAYMNVPQVRERVFFIANRMEYPKLKLDFNEKLITFGEIRSKTGRSITGSMTAERLRHFKVGDRNMSDITEREEDRRTGFNNTFVYDSDVANTVSSGAQFVRVADMTWASNEDIINISTFPQDYNFNGSNTQYICGMSVPPNMMANVAEQIRKQWLTD